MSIPLNDNLKINAPKPIDDRYLNPSNQPYADIAEVNSTILSARRYIGLVVNIANEDYWYKDGITDGDLVVKTTSGGSLPSSTDGELFQNQGGTVVATKQIFYDNGNLAIDFDSTNGIKIFNKNGTSSISVFDDQVQIKGFRITNEQVQDNDGETILTALHELFDRSSNLVFRFSRDLATPLAEFHGDIDFTNATVTGIILQQLFKDTSELGLNNDGELEYTFNGDVKLKHVFDSFFTQQIFVFDDVLKAVSLISTSSVNGGSYNFGNFSPSTPIIQGNLSADPTASGNNWVLPPTDGTIALVETLPVPNLEAVLTAGFSAPTSDLGIKFLYIYENGSTTNSAFFKYDTKILYIINDEDGNGIGLNLGSVEGGEKIYDLPESGTLVSEVKTQTTTTNNTPTNAATIPLNTGEVARINLDVLAKSGDDILSGVKRATIKNVGGTLTNLGVQNIASVQSDIALSGASFTITTSGTDIIIQVTGIAATNIDWFITYKIEKN